MPKFKIGDTVWAAHFNRGAPIKIPCTVCYGTRKVTLLLGNGEAAELPCDYCGHSFEPPTGFETIYEPSSDPESVYITGIELQITEQGETVEYRAVYNGGTYIYKEERLFANRDEAVARGEQLKNEWLEDQRKQIDWLKKDKKKTFAWNAGYHMREVKRLEKEILYHKEKAKLCKERSRKEETNEQTT